MQIPSIPPPGPSKGPAHGPHPTGGPVTPLVPLTSDRPQDAPEHAGAARRAGAVQSDPPAAQQFSVLNDFRYLTDSDKTMLAAVTGETIAPDFTDRPGSASAFALQLALDRRTGELARSQPVTSVYLRNAAEQLDRANSGRPGFTNPYSGEVMTQAVAWLDAHGEHRADLRL